MTRTIGAGLASHIATGRTKLSRCVRLDLRDGTSLGITDHDSDLSANLGDGAITFQAGTGMIPSALSLTVGLEADNLEISGPIGDVVTRLGVLGGRYNRARLRVFDVKWDSPAEFLRLLSGKVSAVRLEAGEFVFEVRSSADAYNQTIGRVISPQCSHDFGEGRCHAVPRTWDATVAAVTDDLRFVVGWTGAAPAPDDIRNGLVEFTSGALLGCLPVEVFSLSGSPPDDLEVYQPLVEVPQVGDALTVTEGCDKLRETCKIKGQILNFGGFPDLTGTDAYVKFPIPHT